MDHDEFETFKDADGQWRWRLFAANGKQITPPSEGYHNYDDMLANARRVLNAELSEVPETAMTFRGVIER